jgi:peptidoglycan/LPS O-acetylase OafA/YrhL
MPGSAPGGTAARRIFDIEILRGAAICMVLIEHLPLNLLTSQHAFFRFATTVWRGAMGVDLFFVISGFVIARGLLPQLEAAASAGATPDALRHFWLSRAFRLLPAAWLWIAIPVGLSTWLGSASVFGDVHQNRDAAVAALLNYANIYVTRFHTVGPPPPATIIYWSLSLEEQFYLLLPLLIVTTRSFLPWVMAGALVYQFTAPLSLLADFTRPGALATGVLLALAARRPWYPRLLPAILVRSAVARGLLSGGCIAGLGVLGVESTPWKLTLVALIAGLLVFAASFDRFAVWPDWRSARLMAWIGSRSYALYLTHMTVFRGVRETVHHFTGVRPPLSVSSDVMEVTVAMSVTLLAAELTHRLVEKPAQALGRRLITPAHVTGPAEPAACP